MEHLDHIAKVCHEANRAYCQAVGDNSQPAWEAAPEWQRQSARTGVQFIVDNPDAGPDASHNSWLAEKKADGWKYGRAKSGVKKTHPMMVPYSDLPDIERRKDALVNAVIDALAKPMR